MTASAVTVTVPATTANLGPGFDCLGVALSLYNRFEFSRLELTQSGSRLSDSGLSNSELSDSGLSDSGLSDSGLSDSGLSDSGQSQRLLIEVTGNESDRVITDNSNLAYQAFCHLYQRLGEAPPPLHLKIDLEVPLARGLGSSATAIVAGLVGANALAGSPFSQTEVMAMAIDLEGHPDNVVPALIGGCRLAATAKDNSWSICDIAWHAGVVPVVAIPNFELSTAEARRVLPTDYSRADAIFNIAHLGLLLRGLETGNPDWLRSALQDRLHQPYRRALIRGYDAVEQAAIAAGAYGLVISGAGPTLLALTHANRAMAVEAAITSAWNATAVSVEVKVLRLDEKGAIARSPQPSH